MGINTVFCNNDRNIFDYNTIFCKSQVFFTEIDSNFIVCFYRKLKKEKPLYMTVKKAIRTAVFL